MTGGPDFGLPAAVFMVAGLLFAGGGIVALAAASPGPDGSLIQVESISYPRPPCRRTGPS